MGVVLVADVPLSVGSRKGKVIESGNWKRTKSVLSGGGLVGVTVNSVGLDGGGGCYGIPYKG